MENKEILLCTINARYSHSSLGLRYLLANMSELKESTKILEFTLEDSTTDILEKIAFQNPKIVGLGIYIWNVEKSFELIKNIRKVLPNTKIVIGGPEVSFGISSEILNEIDFCISNEADLKFYELCKNILSNRIQDQPKIINGIVSNIDLISNPYDEYNDEDIKNRKIYLESSRGCAFKCQFCLSAISDGMRFFDLNSFMINLEKLWDRGVRSFKFIDRTFNLNMVYAKEILEFFLSREDKKFFLHFEFIPDRFPKVLKELISKFEQGQLQLEIGIQSLDGETLARIGRNQDKAKIVDNLNYLKDTSVHLHTDLIFGLPGQSIEIIKNDLNTLIGLEVEEIQLGILKKLKGAPIKIHDHTHSMLYNDYAPFEILSTSTLNFFELMELKRFSKFFDFYYNSGWAIDFLSLIWLKEDPFTAFSKFSNWSFKNLKRDHKISKDKLIENLAKYLVQVLKCSEEEIHLKMGEKLYLNKSKSLPTFLTKRKKKLASKRPVSNKRQLNHQEN